MEQYTDYIGYIAFGMELPGRHSAASTRYGFQGQEIDPEIKGEGNSVNYKYRMHDPRIGRFFAVDPLAAKYPYYSPYAFSGNRVIDSKELEGLEPIGSTKENGEAVHDQGYNINIGGASGTNVPVYQNGEGGALAVTTEGLAALGAAGYSIEPDRSGNPYQSPQMSTDPTKPMVLSVGGTTVTSDHSGGYYDKNQPNKFSMVVITPPQQVQVGTNVTPVVTNGQTPIRTSGSTISGPHSAVPVPFAVSVIAPSVSTEVNNLVSSKPAGTTRVINNVTIMVNANLYSTSQMTQMQTMLNPSGQPYNVTVVPSTTMTPDLYFVGGTATYTDTRNVVTPVMAPTSTGITITDLIK